MADDSQIPMLVGAEDVSKNRQRREFKARLGFCLFLFSVLLLVSGEVWGAAIAGRLAGSSWSNRLASIKYGYGAGLVGALLGGASFAALALRSHVTVHRYVLLEGEDLVGSLAGFFVRRDVACFLVIGVAILGAMAGSVSPDIYDRDHGRPSYEQFRLLGGLAGVVGTGLMLWILYARWRTLDPQ